MVKKVVMGTFDAEKYWRPDNYSKLPEITDVSTSRIVASMDELLFPLCEPDDLLLTRFKTNRVLNSYLSSIGFSFNSYEQDLQDLSQRKSKSDEACVFELIYHNKQENLNSILTTAKNIDSYAILPWTQQAFYKYNIETKIPCIDEVICINSKSYSHELHQRIGLKKYGVIVRSSQEMIEQAKLIGRDGKAFLIKDNYGVSGKGNSLITSSRIFERIVHHVASQEDKGYLTSFLLEPLLDRMLDFSCQVNIDKQGNCNIISVQVIYNQGFSYLGSMTADDDFEKCLEQKGYFQIVTRVAEELYRDGYFGDVCIDSMMLKNNEIVPLVEINARKSMGLINHYIDKRLAQYGLYGYFTFLSVGIKSSTEIDDLLNAFARSGVLFTREQNEGIIPLSANTLFINQDLDDSTKQNKLYKGRFYMSVVSPSQQKRQVLLERTKEILRLMEFNIYN